MEILWPQFERPASVIQRYCDPLFGNYEARDDARLPIQLGPGLMTMQHYGIADLDVPLFVRGFLLYGTTAAGVVVWVWWRMRSVCAGAICHATAMLAHHALELVQISLRWWQSLICGLAVPTHSHGITLLHPLALLVHQPEVVLR